jgi:GDP/UDP-N,N'-diacetylbacillosamine 2-epimerase (hydrolysing)
MKYAEFVLGNSSSGIIETPAFHVPTVNIGDRQRGRLQSESIINCSTETEDIVAAINRAMGAEHHRICERVISPYGDGRAAERIAEKSVAIVLAGNIDLKKKFYDLENV